MMSRKAIETLVQLGGLRNLQWSRDDDVAERSRLVSIRPKTERLQWSRDDDVAERDRPHDTTH